jgi:hypothetical protein
VNLKDYRERKVEEFIVPGSLSDSKHQTYPGSWPHWHKTLQRPKNLSSYYTTLHAQLSTKQKLPGMLKGKRKQSEETNQE